MIIRVRIIMIMISLQGRQQNDDVNSNFVYIFHPNIVHFPHPISHMDRQQLLPCRSGHCHQHPDRKQPNPQLHIHLQLATDHNTISGIWHLEVLGQFSNYTAGADYLLQQNFQIYRLTSSPLSFDLAVELVGWTNLYILKVAYLAVDPRFPYHLNAFDNVPVNYSQGNLVNYFIQIAKVNITKKSHEQSIYENMINYTQQAEGRICSAFNTSASLSNYHIGLFMTSLFIETTKGNNGTNSTHNTSMDLTMSYAILNQSFYQLKVRLKENVKITRLKFSEIIFDSLEIQETRLYMIVFEQWQVGEMGGVWAVESGFQENFIMGLTEFGTLDGECGIDYKWDWVQNDTFSGVSIPQSIMRNGACSLNRSLSTILYIKTLKCTNPYNYYNLTTNLCQNQCGLYFYEAYSVMDNNVQTPYYCKPCQWGCSVCDESDGCLGCNSDDMRLFNGSCYCPHGYLDTRVETKCQPCADANCMICEKNPNYNPSSPNPLFNSINLCLLCSSSYYLNQTTRTCTATANCSSSLNQLINYQTNTCQPCPLTGCLQCKQTLQLRLNNTVMNIMQVGTKRRSLIATSVYGVVTCEQCDVGRGYFMNLTTLECQLCQLDYCLSCTSLYTCALCDHSQQYYLNNKSKRCEYCQVQGCLECINLTTCRTCDYTRGYFLSTTNQTCVSCGIGCLECRLSSVYCTRCADNLSLTNGRCYCPLIGNYITLSPGQQIPTCQPCDPRCKRCENSSSQCVECYFQQNRLLNKIDNTCICNSSNYIEPSLGVVSLVCVKVNTSLCDMGYYYNTITSTCDQICGDGIRISLPCDDGNDIDRDGCSSSCQIQKDFHCTNISYQLSVCDYFGNITVVDYNITKEAYDNVFTMEMKLSPQLVLYQWIVWVERLVFEGSARIDLIEAEMVGADVLVVKGRYYQNIKHIDITLKFLTTTTTNNSSSSLRLLQRNYFHQQSQSINMNITFTFTQLPLDLTKTTNNIKLQYYSQSVYEIAQKFSSVFHIISIVYLAFVLPTLVVMKRMAPVMVVIVAMQMCYMTVMGVGDLQPVAYALVNNFYYVYGLNNLIVLNQYCEQQPEQTVHSVLGAANFSSCFLKNINLMIIFEFVAIVGMVGTAVLGIRFRSARQWFNVCKRALNNMVFFNLSHTALSVALINWHHVHFLQILLSLFQLLLTLYHIYLILNPKRQYYIQIQMEDFLLARDIRLKHEQNKIIMENNISDIIAQQEEQSKGDVAINQGGNSNNNDSSLTIVNKNNKKDTTNNNDVKATDNGWQQQIRGDLNKQALYFTCFIISLACISPLCYLLLPHSPLASNLIAAGLLLLLITIHLITMPFHHNPNSLYQSFTKIPLNYFTVYTFCSLFVAGNLVVYILEKEFNDHSGDQIEIEKEMKGETVIAYVQVGVFLVMVVYGLVVWWYAVYLSFFEDEVIEAQSKIIKNKEYKQKQQTSLRQQLQSHQLENPQPETLQKTQQPQLSLSPITQRRRLSKRHNPKSQQITRTKAMKVTDLSSVNDNIIFQIDNDDETYQNEEVFNNNRA